MILIVGSRGQLGSALMRVYEDRAPVGVEHRLFDVEDAAAVATLFARYRPDVVINTAAYHVVDLCETRPERAFAVNAFAVDRLAAHCTAASARFVHISTDYVFDGTATEPYPEDAATAPLNAYGASKVAGEHLLRRHGAEHVVVRTSGLYGATGAASKGGSFAERTLRAARAGEPMRVVDDVTTTPSHVAHVAAAIRAIVDAGATGTYHVTNAGSCTWHAFAMELVRQAGFDARIEAVPSATFASIVRRPAYSVLAPGAMRAAGLAPLPAWEDGIRDYLASL